MQFLTGLIPAFDALFGKGAFQLQQDDDQKVNPNAVTVTASMLDAILKQYYSESIAKSVLSDQTLYNKILNKAVDEKVMAHPAAYKFIGPQKVYKWDGLDDDDEMVDPNK